MLSSYFLQFISVNQSILSLIHCKHLYKTKIFLTGKPHNWRICGSPRFVPVASLRGDFPQLLRGFGDKKKVGSVGRPLLRRSQGKKKKVFVFFVMKYLQIFMMAEKFVVSAIPSFYCI